MSELIKRNANLLQFLCTCKKSKQLNALVKVLDHDQLRAIAECNHNVIKGTVPLSKAQLATLKRKRKDLLDLDEDDDIAHLQGTARRKALDEKRRRIIQKGGLLPALLAPLLGAIISPLAKLGVNAVTSSVASRRQRKIHEQQHKQSVKRLRKKKQ